MADLYQQQYQSFQHQQHHHQSQSLAYWRSLAIGLQYENQQLLDLITRLSTSHHNNNVLQDHVATRGKSKKDSSSKKRSTTKVNEDQVPESNSQTPSIEDAAVDDVDDDDHLDEYLKFVMETEKHRQERDATIKPISKKSNMEKKSRLVSEDVDEDYDEKLENIAVDHERLKKEMVDLYGKDAVKIHCQETRLELEFNQWKDKHRPVVWPAMPLNTRH